MKICLRRRDFIAGLGATAWPVAVRTQQRAMPVVGGLSGRNSETDAPRVAGVSRHGGDVSRTQALAQELVDLTSS
jgi:hypothetical protein